MKARVAILDLADHGDRVRVKAQGQSKRQAEWQPPLVFEFTVLPHIGTRYRIGQELIVEVKPA